MPPSRCAVSDDASPPGNFGSRILGAAAAGYILSDLRRLPGSQKGRSLDLTFAQNCEPQCDGRVRSLCTPRAAVIARSRLLRVRVCLYVTACSSAATMVVAARAVLCATPATRATCLAAASRTRACPAATARSAVCRVGSTAICEILIVCRVQ